MAIAHLNFNFVRANTEKNKAKNLNIEDFVGFKKLDYTSQYFDMVTKFKNIKNTEVVFAKSDEDYTRKVLEKRQKRQRKNKLNE